MTLGAHQSKKCIAIFLPDLYHGGEQRNLVNIANQFVRAGYKVDFLLVKDQGPLIDKLSNEVNVIRFRTTIILSLSHLFHYLRNNTPDVLLSSLELTNVIALLAVKLSGVKCKTAIRIAVATSFHRQSKWVRFLERGVLHFVYPWADEIIACSDGVRQDLIAYAGLRIGHLRTIFNPIVRPELFIESNKAVEHKWITESDGIPLILAIGRMTQQKDFTTLIKAVSLINQTRRARLIILGDGEDRVELERLILSLDIQDVVDLPGFLDNPYPFYKHADAFVLSSRWEGLPSVLIEALALDCPIVSTNCPYGADEILNGGEFGEIIPMGDVTLMADAISASLNGKKSGKPSQDWISQFSMDVIFLELVDALGLR